jgi:hypothetical protein
VRIWRLQRSRSLRRYANAALRKERIVPSGVAARRRLLVALRQPSWRLAITTAAVAHVPAVVASMGRNVPGWFDTSWQVSATLVGLGIALVIFVLQAAASQSVASQTVYRAVIGYTGLVWPAALALVFLLSIATVERFEVDTARDVPAWGDTWMLVAFAIQVVAFGIAFAQTLKVVAPRGISRVVGLAFDDAIRHGVLVALRRRVMIVKWHELCETAGVSWGTFMSSGRPIVADRAGTLADVDMRLPDRVATSGLLDRVRFTFTPGDRIGPDDPLIKVDGLGGSWFVRVVRQSTSIDRGGGAEGTVEVFDDVLDAARRARRSGSRQGLQQSLRLIVDCIALVPEAYAEWGITYSVETVSEPFAIVPEQQMLHNFARFSDETMRSSPQELVELMPQVVAGIVDAVGDRDRAPLLVTVALSVWVWQARSASELLDASGASAVRAQIARLGGQAASLLQHRLEDGDLDLERRLAATTGLERLFRHQAHLMKRYIDEVDEEAFVVVWEQWSQWAKFWTPEHDLEDHQLLTVTGTSREQRRASQITARLESLAAAKRSLAEERAKQMCVLGGWATWRLDAGRLDEASWGRLAGYLVGGADVDAMAAVRLVRWIWTEAEIGSLERWELDEGQGSGSLTARASAQLWALALLVQSVGSGTSPTLDFGDNTEHLVEHLKQGLLELRNRPDRWGRVISPDLEGRVAAVSAAIEDAADRARATYATALAEADLDPTRVAEYGRIQRTKYVELDVVRKLLLTRGGVSTEFSASAFDNVVPRLLPKRPFVDVPGREILIDRAQPAVALAHDALFEAYSSFARAAPVFAGQGSAAVVAAIEQLKSAGYSPDAVLIPRAWQLRRALASHDLWDWTPRGFIESPDHIATLAGVPVFAVGPEDGQALVVCDLAKSMRRVERRREGDESPVFVDVRQIGQERSAVMVARGQTVAGVGDGADAQATALREGYVEAFVGLSTRWELEEPRAMWGVSRPIDPPPPGPNPGPN